MALRTDSRFHTVRVLSEFDRTRNRLSTVFADYFQSTKLLPDERRTITHLVQETTRWRGYLDHLLFGLYRGRYQKAERLLKNILRLGAYEIIFRNRVPVYAIIDEAVKLTRTLVSARASAVTNAILRQIDRALRPDLGTLNAHDPPVKIAAVTSHPQWMIERWLDHFGLERTLRLCAWDNSLPTFMIRRNQTKINREEFEAILSRLDLRWTRCKDEPQFYQVERLGPLRGSSAFTEGLFTIQDASAGLVSHLVDGSSGSILDACAAPGGKTTYLAERLGNKGTIQAYDLDEARLERVVENSARLGLRSITVERKDATTDRYPTSKAILLDVPCTGTGVMAKRADLRWRRTERDIGQMHNLQLRLLFHMAEFVQVGGSIVYSTCSLEPEENRDVVDAFLHQQLHFKVKEPGSDIPPKLVDSRAALRTFPPDHGMDGVFGVILERVR